MSAVLDHTLLTDLDGPRLGRLWEDGVGHDGIDKVERARLGVGGGDGPLLEREQSEVGAVEVFSYLGFEGVRHAFLRLRLSQRPHVVLEGNMTNLDEGLEERLGEPGGEPPVVLGDGKVKVLDLDLDVLDDKERLVVALVGIFERDVKVDTLRTKLEVEQTVVFEWPEASLSVDPEGDVGGFKVETLDTESDRRVVLGRVWVVSCRPLHYLMR